MAPMQGLQTPSPLVPMLAIGGDHSPTKRTMHPQHPQHARRRAPQHPSQQEQQRQQQDQAFSSSLAFLPAQSALDPPNLLSSMNRANHLLSSMNRANLRANLNLNLPSQKGVKRNIIRGEEQQPIRRIKSTPLLASLGKTNASRTQPLADALEERDHFDDAEGKDFDFGLPEGKEGGKGSGDQKAQRRLARKAEAARQSRRRKKAYVTSLEEQVVRLQTKLAGLEAGLESNNGVEDLPGSGSGSVDELHCEEQKHLKARVIQILSENTEWKQHGLPAAASAELKQLLDRFVSNSRKRQNAVGFYLNKLGTCIVPQPEMKFAMWGLNQKDQFYEKDKPGLWNAVMSREVGAEQRQMDLLMQLRGSVGALVRGLAETTGNLDQTTKAIHESLTHRHQHMDQLRASLTPPQLAAFVTWVDRNPLSMQLQ